MFCVTPEGKNRFFISCNDHDLEKLAKSIPEHVKDKALIQVEMCKALEDILTKAVSV